MPYNAHQRCIEYSCDVPCRVTWIVFNWHFDYKLVGTSLVFQITAERQQAYRNVFSLSDRNIHWWTTTGLPERFRSYRSKFPQMNDYRLDGTFSVFHIKMSTIERLLACRNIFGHPDQNVHCWTTTGLPERFRSSRSKFLLLNNDRSAATFSVF